MKSSIATTIAAVLALACGSVVSARSIFTGTGGALTEFDQANGTNGVFTSTITVTENIGITSMSIMLKDFWHTWSGDLVIQLQKVGGPTATLVHRVGSINGTFGAQNPYGRWTGAPNPEFTGLVGDNYTFANAGTNIWATALAQTDPLAAIAGGTYQTSGLVAAPGAPWGASAALNVFNGVNAIGQWKLIITDMSSPNTGALGSWELNVVPEPSVLALLMLTGLANRGRRRS